MNFISSSRTSTKWMLPNAARLLLLLCTLSAGCMSRGQPVAEGINQPPAAPDSAAMVPDHPKTVVASEAPPPLCEQNRKGKRYAWLSMAHNTLEGFSCNTALWLDSVLGDIPDPESARKANGQLDTYLTYSEFAGTDVRVRLRAEIPLPNLQKRLSAFVGRIDEQSFIQDRPEAQQLNDQFVNFQGSDEFLAGLGYALPGGERLQTSFRVGVRNLRRPSVFAQARFFYSPYSDQVNLVYVRSTPFWNSNDGFGITNGLEYNRFLRATRLFRLSSSGTLSQKTEGLSWVVSSVVYQDLHKGRALAPEVFVRGETDEPEPLQEYGLRATYRQPVFDNGLFMRLAPGYSWPRDDPNKPRNGSFNILLGAELPFGQRDGR